MVLVADIRSDEEVTAAIVAGHEQLCEVLSGLLSHVAELDRREAWRRYGATSAERFLVSELDLSWRTARDWVRVAHLVGRRPALAEQFAAGTFSFDAMAGLAGVMAARDESVVAPAGPFDEPAPAPDGPSDPSDGTAEPTTGEADDGDSPSPDTGAEEATPDEYPGAGGTSDDDLIGLASEMSAAQLASMAVRLRRRSAEAAAAAHRRRHVEAWLDEADGRLGLRAALFDDQAGTVWAALMDFAGTCDPDPACGRMDPLAMRFADALEAMAIAYLAGRSHAASHPALFVHADVSILAGGEGWAHTSTNLTLCAETVRRLACACDLTLVLHDGDDRLKMGRTRRTATWQQAAMVRRRDGGCRFPGCRRSLWIQCHHIREWDAHRGRTDYENLAALCSFHHHLVHEGGWKMTGDGCRELRFSDPSGQIRLSSWPNPGTVTDRRKGERWENGERSPEASSGVVVGHSVGGPGPPGSGPPGAGLPQTPNDSAPPQERPFPPCVPIAMQFDGLVHAH